MIKDDADNTIEDTDWIFDSSSLRNRPHPSQPPSVKSVIPIKVIPVPVIYPRFEIPKSQSASIREIRDSSLPNQH
jgi:hypothetical protein